MLTCTAYLTVSLNMMLKRILPAVALSSSVSTSRAQERPDVLFLAIDDLKHNLAGEPALTDVKKRLARWLPETNAPSVTPDRK